VILSILLAAGLFPPTQMAPAVFANDARLRPPISMRAKIVSLADFTAQLQKLTKVHFSAADDIADRKITTIFHDRPAAELMGAVQNVMFMEWKKVGDGYRIFLPPKVEHEEQDMIGAESEALKNALSKALQSYAKAAKLSKDEIAQQDTILKAKIAAAQADASPDGAANLEALREDRAVLHGAGPGALCSQLAGNLSAASDELFAGETIVGSTRPEDGAVTLPANLVDGMRQYMPDALCTMVMMRLNVEQQIIEGKVVTANSETMGGNMNSIFQYHPLAHTPADLKSSKLMARIKKWQEQADAKVLDKAIATDGPPEAKPDYFNRFVGGFTLAEHLEYLADRSDIPVVGDAFRLYCTRPGYLGAPTVRAYLEGLKQAQLGLQTSPVSLFATSGGWLMARHDGFWRRQIAEIPEALLLPLESAAKTQEFPSVDDYARLAAGLTLPQTHAVEYDSTHRALRFDTMPFRDCLWSLRLWATLTPAQAAQSQSGGLALTSVSPVQQRIVLDGWADKMWSGSLAAGLWANMLSPAGLANAHPILKFRNMDDNKPNPDQAAPRQVGAAWHRATFQYDLGQNQSIYDPFVLSPTHS